MLDLTAVHKRLLVSMARNDGMAIVSLEVLKSDPVQELFEANLLQVFRIGRINDDTVELCLTVRGWKEAQKLRHDGDGDGART